MGRTLPAVARLCQDARSEGVGPERSTIARVMAATPRIRIGISACLLGDEVRYDGGHKRDPFLVDVLGSFVEWVKVCPEVEIGMGTPREAIRLTEEAGGSAC